MVEVQQGEGMIELFAPARTINGEPVTGLAELRRDNHKQSWKLVIDGFTNNHLGVGKRMVIELDGGRTVTGDFVLNTVDTENRREHYTSIGPVTLELTVALFEW